MGTSGVSGIDWSGVSDCLGFNRVVGTATTKKDDCSAELGVYRSLLGVQERTYYVDGTVHLGPACGVGEASLATTSRGAWIMTNAFRGFRGDLARVRELRKGL